MFGTSCMVRLIRTLDVLCFHFRDEETEAQGIRNDPDISTWQIWVRNLSQHDCGPLRQAEGFPECLLSIGTDSRVCALEWPCSPEASLGRAPGLRVTPHHSPLCTAVSSGLKIKS